MQGEKVYELWIDAAQKFDYFVTGVCLAIVGYLASNFRLGPLALNSDTLQLLAALAILASAWCGLKRIQKTATLLGVSSQRVFSEEVSADLERGAIEGKLATNRVTGAVLTPDAAFAKAAQHQSAAQGLSHEERKLIVSARPWYSWRDRLLLAGFAGLLLSKVLAGYGW